MLQFRNACKRNIESVQISIESWESATADCNNWRQAVWRGIRKTEERRNKLDGEESPGAHQSLIDCYLKSDPRK